MTVVEKGRRKEGCMSFFSRRYGIEWMDIDGVPL